MKIRLPTPLHSYTAGASEVDAEGSTLGELLSDLDKQFPGIRFRVVDEQGALRRHMKIFVDKEQVRDLDTPVDASAEVVLMQALSGG